jgi:uncharacterized protein
MRCFHCTVAFLLLAAAGAVAQPAAPGDARQAEFTVFFKNVAIGSELVSVSRTAAGMTITGSSRLGAPINVTIRKVSIEYDADGAPKAFSLDGSARDQLLAIQTTFAGTTASSAIAQGSNNLQKTDQVAPRALIVPNVFFGAYEAVAARLASANAGDELMLYVLPQAQIAAQVVSVSEERLRTPAGPVQARISRLKLMNPGAPLDAEVWSDASGRLLRFRVPVQSLDIARTDIVSVSARREPVSHPGDEHVFIPSNGFSLAATVSKPLAAARAAAGTRFPAIVMIGGSGPTDRDETVAGVPIFGELANGLADAGFIVVRYDKRGVGQSGGRAEAATLPDYTEDALAAVKYLRDRKDVDDKRVAVLGHSEGGCVALMAAARTKDIDAVVLIGTPGVTGAQLILDQQRHALEALKMPDAEKQAKIALQQKIQQAVLTGKGWEGVPPEVRKQADTPWFQSFLAWDPAKVVREVRQPILIVQGELDRQVAPSNAAALEKLAKSRKGPAGQAVKVVMLPGINHLLLPAATGEVDEYGQLSDKTVSPEATSAIASWLTETLPPAKSR